MSLRTELQLPEVTSLTDQEALDLMLSTVELGRDETAYTWSGTNERLGQMGLPFEVLAGWDTVLLALPGGSMFDRMLASGGVNYTLPNVRAGLQAVLDADPAEPVPTVISSLMAIGIQYGPYWTHPDKGISVEPTLEDIQSTRATIASLALQQQVLERYNSVVTAMDAGTCVTWDDAIALLGAP